MRGPRSVLNTSTPQSAAHWPTLHGEEPVLDQPAVCLPRHPVADDDEVKLTAWGKLLQGPLRLTAPVLLGLTLLAIWARTKR